MKINGNELQDEDLITMSTFALGNLEIDRNKYLPAIRYFLKIDSIYSLPKDVSYIRRGLTLQNVGNIYKDHIIDLDKALKYYYQA